VHPPFLKEGRGGFVESVSFTERAQHAKVERNPPM